MIVLGIETSCDDTSAAVFDGSSLLSNIISTQLIHQRFGGVVPELASRSHIQLVFPVIREALGKAGISKDDIEGIAVTYGPGLVGSLLVGLSVAKGMALSLKVPFVGVNHLEGHLWANRLAYPDITPPFIALIVSGGHTQLVLVERWGGYRMLGRTRDDAAGEAFDKIGKLLNIGYPGGPPIEKLARKGDPKYIHFPRAFLGDKSLDFSFSGVKTAVLNYVRSIGPKDTEKHLANIAASFQQAIIDVLVEKTIAAAKEFGIDTVCLSGGVAVNKALQEDMKQKAYPENIKVYCPPPQLCTDNGGMIAAVGYYYLHEGITSSLNLSPSPSLNF